MEPWKSASARVLSSRQHPGPEITALNDWWFLPIHGLMCSTSFCFFFFALAEKLNCLLMVYWYGLPQWSPFSHFTSNAWFKMFERRFLCAGETNGISVLQKEVKWVSQGLSWKTHPSAPKPLFPLLPACLEAIHCFLKPCLKRLCSYSMTVSCHALSWEY